MESGKSDTSFKAKGAPSASPLGAGGDAFPGKLHIEETHWPCSLDWDSETVSGFWAQDLWRRQDLFSQRNWPNEQETRCGCRSGSRWALGS